MRNDIFYDAQQRDVVLALQKRSLTEATHGSDTITFDEGYWTFDMIQDKLRDNKIALKYNTYDNTCKIYSVRYTQTKR